MLQPEAILDSYLQNNLNQLYVSLIQTWDCTYSHLFEL